MNNKDRNEIMSMLSYFNSLGNPSVEYNFFTKQGTFVSCQLNYATGLFYITNIQFLPYNT